MQDHWARTEPLWPGGAERVTRLVVFAPDAPVTRVARRLAPLLSVPYLDIVPPEWLHLTLEGEPQQWRFDRVRVVDEGVVLEADGPGWPHVSLAYGNREADASALERALAEVSVDADSSGSAVVLVRLRRAGRCYVWEPA